MPIKNDTAIVLANRSIAESERLNFIENSIAPLCARLEAAVDMCFDEGSTTARMRPRIECR